MDTLANLLCINLPEIITHIERMFVTLTTMSEVATTKHENPPLTLL